MRKRIDRSSSLSDKCCKAIFSSLTILIILSTLSFLVFAENTPTNSKIEWTNYFKVVPQRIFVEEAKPTVQTFSIDQAYVIEIENKSYYLELSGLAGSSINLKFYNAEFPELFLFQNKTQQVKLAQKDVSFNLISVRNDYGLVEIKWIPIEIKPTPVEVPQVVAPVVAPPVEKIPDLPNTNLNVSAINNTNTTTNLFIDISKLSDLNFLIASIGTAVLIGLIVILIFRIKNIIKKKKTVKNQVAEKSATISSVNTPGNANTNITNTENNANNNSNTTDSNNVSNNILEKNTNSEIKTSNAVEPTPIVQKPLENKPNASENENAITKKEDVTQMKDELPLINDESLVDQNPKSQENINIPEIEQIVFDKNKEKKKNTSNNSSRKSKVVSKNKKSNVKPKKKGKK